MLLARPVLRPCCSYASNVAGLRHRRHRAQVPVEGGPRSANRQRQGVLPEVKEGRGHVPFPDRCAGRVRLHADGQRPGSASTSLWTTRAARRCSAPTRSSWSVASPKNTPALTACFFLLSFSFCAGPGGPCACPLRSVHVGRSGFDCANHVALFFVDAHARVADMAVPLLPPPAPLSHLRRFAQLSKAQSLLLFLCPCPVAIGRRRAPPGMASARRTRRRRSSAP